MRVELRWPLAAATPEEAPRALVLDTNIVLDLLVFGDPAVAPVRDLLGAGQLRWLATGAMREELERVLAYPHIVPRLAFYGLSVASVVQAFDAQVQLAPVAPRVPPACRDADDQKFLDLAAAHRAVLLSKDKAVVVLRRRMLAHGAHVGSALVWAPVCAPSGAPGAAPTGAGRVLA
ncbi:putative toxin-antitoxin system toxin component, PIN family [Acidovorax sp. SRB_14]|nr:putative toxin-antitoxin system toxin component, PIN family [Acidovorax sp. SRB_14]NMM81230.1 putative toxin-antitoxin system toxin component, PIN family [Acidovorax sp. SRB_14]